MSTAAQRNNNEESGLQGTCRHPFFRAVLYNLYFSYSKQICVSANTGVKMNLLQKLYLALYFLFFWEGRRVMFDVKGANRQSSQLRGD